MVSSGETRSNRINSGYKLIKSGKTWKQVNLYYLQMGVTKQTASSYTDAIEGRLRREGLIK